MNLGRGGVHPSIRVRVTAVAAAVVLGVLFAGAVGLTGLLRSGLLRSAAGSALQRASEVSALAARAPLPAVLPAVDAPRRTLIQVVDGGGAVIAATPPLTETPALVGSHAGTSSIGRQAALGPGRWLSQSISATVGGRIVTVIVYTSLSDVDRTMRLFVGLMALAVPVATALVAGVVWAGTGRALQPVEAMRQEVASITASRLGHRVAEPPARDEIARLAATLNDMLGRLQDANERQRQFMADASHELRTPLANIRTALEVAATHPDRADWVAVAQDAVAQTERMRRLTDDLMALASGDAERPAGVPEAVDLAAVVRAELERPPGDGIRIGAAGQLPPTFVVGDPQMLTRALTNLVDNALRHAHTRVEVGLRSGRTWAEVWVSDDGAGVPPADRDRIFDRFVRVDDDRSRSGGGVGLGLAIVREIAAEHGGTVTLDPVGDGATFRLRLPLTAPSADS